MGRKPRTILGATLVATASNEHNFIPRNRAPLGGIMSALSFRTLVQWPRALAKHRTNSRFDSDYQSTIDLLLRELRMVSAHRATIHMAMSARNARKDGFPRADARPDHPGVWLTFEVRKNDGTLTSLTYPCDTYFSWMDNLRAIAVTLEDLRRIARNGVGAGDEQYAGYALPPASTPASTSSPAFEPHQSAAAPTQLYRVPDGPFETQIIAARYIVNWAGEGLPEHIIHAPGERDRLIKLAKGKAHPDAPGGSDAAFLRLTQAIERAK